MVLVTDYKDFYSFNKRNIHDTQLCMSLVFKSVSESNPNTEAAPARHDQQHSTTHSNTTILSAHNTHPDRRSTVPHHTTHHQTHTTLTHANSILGEDNKGQNTILYLSPSNLRVKTNPCHLAQLPYHLLPCPPCLPPHSAPPCRPCQPLCPVKGAI